MGNPVAAVAAWLNETAVQIDMTVSGRSRNEAAAVIAERKRAAARRREALAVQREFEKQQALVLRAAKQRQAEIRRAEQKQQALVEKNARAVVRQQERLAREHKAREVAAYEQRCNDEAMYRRMAVTAAQNEAKKLVDGLGFDDWWVGTPWLESNRTERQKYRSDLVQKYTNELMARQNGPYDQMMQQNAWGDANFAHGLHVSHALKGTSGGDAGSFRFED